jgi:uncharacterized NAD(P)/FAD-binding protein YdhS
MGHPLSENSHFGHISVPDEARHVIVIGGGASGVLLATHLLRRSGSGFRVTLIEKRPDVGRGVAYCTANPEHLLNVRASNMSALPQEPDHFWRWLCARYAGPEGANAPPPVEDSFYFAPRQVYGDYIASLIEPLLGAHGRSSGLHIVQGECVRVGETANGAVVHLADGTCHRGDFAVLATGHELPPIGKDCYADPWTNPWHSGIAPNDRILILGTGLTMIDYVLSLLLAGFRGQIIAMSRRGLLPTAHSHVDPLPIRLEDVPIGANASVLLRWFRDLVAAHTEWGGDWRSVVDGIRPFTQQIWWGLPLASKRGFLEHARAWWDIHRHRMAPEVERRIRFEVGAGALTVIAGKIIAVEPDGQGALVRYRRRGHHAVRTMHVAKIIECTGMTKDPLQTTNPALRSLFQQGLARVDPLGIGMDVTAACAIINRSGVPSERLFAIGPLTRAAFWEVVAVPDIRNQCTELAAWLAHVRPVGTQRHAIAAVTL